MTRAQKRRAIQLRRNLYTAVIVSVILILAVLLISRFTLKSNAKSEHEMYLYYTSVTVSAGDSLWSIADEYHTVECGDMRDYIREIKRLNHLATDDIHAGAALVIPYYSADMK